ncbi:sodium:proton antiporter [Pseudomonas fluvialis]|uniref:Sodium:proton antiporter n=1 Tax=Pseudomonas fluvialis TaxID=1793966 RepID=A0A2I0CQK2_9PSED|nr:monovalent cation:proton antiporter family protein [Pseudomonas pharmacofabricae]PKF71427.1 sodium:proton antiporter [Pseudomonas pharmacofabricae]
MFANLLIILVASLITIALFRRLNLPPLLGYLCVGVLCGPFAAGWISAGGQDMSILAEMGVVFLLFTLGLEFSLPRMLALKSTVFGLGSLQVICTSLPLAALLHLYGLSLAVSLTLAAGLALSSTAIVSKELSSLGEIFTPHGQNAIGVLLFQDLVAVLLLTLLPLISGGSEQAWYVALPLTLGKAVLLFIGLLVASRWLLPRLFHEVAAARSNELFLLMALVIVLLTAWLTHLLGLSMALGAFLAGMLLGESHYRHQIEADIRPFRDVLLGLFFVSVGMLIDLRLFLSHGLTIIALTLLLIAIKGLIVALLVRLRGNTTTVAWRSGLALAQGGEFFFALLAQMQSSTLLDSNLASLLLAAVFCSMSVTPLLLRGAPRLAARLQRRHSGDSSLEAISASGEAQQGHVLICGYGRVGQSIGRFLRRENIPYIALDDDPVRVQEAAAGEDHVHYGDCRRADLLQAMNIAQARLLVVAVDNSEAALQIVEQARRLQAELQILVRTRDDSKLDALLALGANEVVPELLESSLMLASHALVMLGLPESRVQQSMDAVRAGRYRLLHGFYHGGHADLLGQHQQPRTLLHAVTLSAQASACQRSLDELQLEQLGVEIQGIRRHGEELSPAPQLRLQAGDTLLLAGPLAAIESSEAHLLAS